MTVDSLALQLTSALQRFHSLQRRAADHQESPALLARSLAELGTTLEELSVAQDQIIENRHRLERMQVELSDQCARYWQLFDEMPQPSVVTRADSIILEANRAGAELFNVSQRFLVGKAMSVFVCEDRAHFLTELTRIIGDDEPLTMNLKLRPRERAPLMIEAKVKADSSQLRWVLSPLKQSSS